MRLIKKFESYSQEREEMCKYLCNVCGCSMHELHDKSDEELEMMCRTMADSHNNHSHMNSHNENMNSMDRESMCKYLCNVCGCSMHELHDKSDEELEMMCRTMAHSHDTHMNSHNENMNSMDRESMCNYLCRCGYSEDELEMCSDEELRLMCKDHEEEDAYNNDEELLGESKKSKKLKGLKEHQETQNYMFFSNLETIKRLVDEMLEMDEHTLDNMLSEHDWASDHISVAAENIEHVFNFVAGHEEPQQDHDDYDTESEMRGIRSFEDFKK